MDGDAREELRLLRGMHRDRMRETDIARWIELERKDATAELNARVTALEEEMRIVRGANKLPGKA